MRKMNKEDFIEKSKIIHGNKYLYDKVNYINSKIKVIITCKFHGDFEQMPNSHLIGQGCPNCGGKKRLNTKDFIEKSKIIHGNKYLYDKVNYINNKTNIILICKIHGEFEQTPSSNLCGYGCIKCGGKEKLNTEEFIKRSKLIHENKYIYDKVNYTSIMDKVIITCKKHGDFTQIASLHINNKYGCPKCGGKEKLNTEEFIKRSKLIHENKYVYDKVNYINNITNVIITCKKHDDFTQTPSYHLNKGGCPDCGGSKKLNKDTFINKSNKIHNYIYTYDKVEYINNKTKVLITCKKHGDFEQAPFTHLCKSGCPKCNLSKGEIIIGNILIENNIKYKPQYSFNDLKYKSNLYFDFGILDNDNKLKYLLGLEDGQELTFFNIQKYMNKHFVKCVAEI